MQGYFDSGYTVIVEVPFEEGGLAHLDVPLVGRYDGGTLHRLVFSVDGYYGHWGFELTGVGDLTYFVGFGTGNAFATRFGEPYGKTYQQGSGITISGDTISVDSALTQTIAGKQDALQAGDHIQISGSTISAYGFVESASGSPIETKYIWQGTGGDYDAMASHRNDTLYIVR